MKDKIVEAVLFASDEPVSTDKLMEIAGGIAEDDLLGGIDALNNEYERTGRTFRIVEVAGGFQFETLPAYGMFVEQLFHTRTRPKLSRAALETLAIVAYKQPVSRAEIDAFRGVDSDASVRTLQNRGLIEVTGRSDAVGKPLLYGTTREFLRYFGLNDIGELPGADDLASMFDGSETVEQSPDQLSIDTDALDLRSGDAAGDTPDERGTANKPDGGGGAS